ncbi:carboxymuconolactone decarboxylase family protein [Achromobacter xylosoxidans]|uniref:carboxymuconolactone decarboxylase family protein n=1 Tax=Alcaligenes xylosoxydans xylosoxydans TaxID=85698 RepID=UPI0022B93C1E|nr:carboxymuconolactone decarboxylase family protein [Achromobacter xylosoxidans]MCZ8392040.1 carboxymuconolactone decarboxylase family protein [Achromobacter xylosoxidans]
MSRIPLPTPDSMSDDQKRVYERIVSGPRGRLVGPLRAALHNPELAERWQALGALLRFGTSLPPRVSELAIVVTARRWNSQIEWHIHAQAARAAGIADAVLDAIQARREPVFDNRDDEIVYAYARQLQETGQVNPALYAEAVRRWAAVGVVELTAVIGYYTMVSMTLNAHEIPMPDDAPAPLDQPQQDGWPALSRLVPLAGEGQA